MAHMKNNLGEYAGDIEAAGFFDSTPKSVFADLAMSAALRINDDDFHAAKKWLVEEWVVLHDNKITPQKPPTKLLREYGT